MKQLSVLAQSLSSPPFPSSKAHTPGPFSPFLAFLSTSHLASSLSQRVQLHAQSRRYRFFGTLLMAPSTCSSLTRFLALFLYLTLVSNLVCALPQHRPHVITAPLEMRRPKPMLPNSHRGFPYSLRIHEPTLVPLQSSPMHTLSYPETKLNWAARFHDVTLFGGMVAVGEYYAKVQIGGQTLRVQIDTGSATLAVPVKECTNCKRGDMRYAIDDSKSGIAEHISCDDQICGKETCSSFGCGKCSAKRACCAQSDHDLCAFHLNFGDGSGAKGILIRDNLKWGDLEFPVVFGGIRSDSPDFERSQVDGILGMAYPSLACNPSCITPTFESMLQKHAVKDMFSICITYDSGRIVLGDYDPLMSTKELSWVKLDTGDPPSFYSFPLVGNLKVNDVDLPLPSYSRAIVDSGTTLIVFSHATFNKFKGYLEKNFCSVPGLCATNSWFRPAHCTKIRDEDRMKMPTLKFAIEGFDIVLGPSEYLINYASKGPEYWCVGIMALNSMSGGVDVIFGNTVMKKYVTVYDRKAKRVGFAESDTKCGFDVRKGQAASIPITDPEGEKKKPGEQLSEGEEEEENGGGNDVVGNPEQGETKSADQKSSGAEAAAKCGAAQNCTACSEVKDVSCSWDGAEGLCVSGERRLFMCAVENLAGKLVYVVGGGIAAVVVVIAIIGVGVHTYRKRNSAAGSEDDGELQRPLVQSEVDTRNAFALEDDDDP